MPTIGIMSTSGDVHAAAVALALRARNVQCHVIETDGLAVRGRYAWSSHESLLPSRVLDADGTLVELRELDVVWCRRLNGNAGVPQACVEPSVGETVDESISAFVTGLAQVGSGAALINSPASAALGRNKLVQLRAATEVGLRVPRTLVSQAPEEIRPFCAGLEYEVVVKPLATRYAYATGRVTTEMLDNDASLRLCPGVYQELVPGSRHLRVCCFGDDIHAVELETPDLDWRVRNAYAARPVSLDAGLAERLRALHRKLGLRMGIVDMKRTDDGGDPYFFEVNEQGQFLFLQGECDLPLLDLFADFLESEAERADLQRRRSDRADGTRRPRGHDLLGSELVADSPPL